ncbi:MAG: SLC13 family permease [Syntrophobacteraceae bacterium]|jgi:di/tricarboxylate transporter
MFDQFLVLIVIILALILFAWGRWRYDIVAIVALLVLAAAGIIPADHVFNGFGNPAVITVAAVMVVSRGMWNAGAPDALATALAGLGDRLWVPVITGVTSLVSAFVDDTGTTGIMMPVAIQLARKNEQSPSKVLMPIAFASLLGGCITLIGTPSNILVAGFRQQVTGKAFSLFDFTPVGLSLTLAGLVFIWLIGWKLVPVRRSTDSNDELFEIADYLTEVAVPQESPFVEKTIGELEKALKEDVLILGIVRGKRRLSVLSRLEALRAKDVLIVEADANSLKAFLDTSKFVLAAEQDLAKEFLTSAEIGMVEGVIGAGSRMVGRTLAQMNLRRFYGANVLAVSRQGHRLKERLAGIRLQSGDVLLLQGDTENLGTVLDRLGCLPLAKRSLRIDKPTRIVTAVLIFLGVVLLSALGTLPVQVAFTAGAVLMVLSGIINPRELYESVDWPLIVLLGAFIPVGEAMQNTGITRSIANALLPVAGRMPHVVSIGVVLAVTLLLSNIINHTAAAVIMAPIAIGIAEGFGASVDPFLMAVAVGVSSPFLTPIGHQANTLVMGPGGYAFGDYWRLGLPLSLLVVGLVPFLIEIFWPF